MPRFNRVFSRNNVHKRRDGAFLSNPYKFKSIEWHWLALDGNSDSVKYLDSLEGEYILKEIGNKSMTATVYRIQANDSIICGYFSYWI